MRKIWRCLLGGMVVTGGLLLIPILGYASEENGNEVSYDQVATEEEQVKPQEVGVEGMTPIYATDVADGVYEVEVESSSSMFRVEHAELTVQGGDGSRPDDGRDRVSQAVYGDKRRGSYGRDIRLY